MRDGTGLFYRAWLPAAKADRAVILFHRGHEHSGRWQDLVDEIGLGDFALFAWDARGHGRPPGERGCAESVGTLVRASLSGLARAVEAGGYLVYTNQPWHPQIEFIARVLTSHRDGGAWVMRPRAQAEMDGLVREAGFEKIAMEIDDDGIFSVSVARKVA